MPVESAADRAALFNADEFGEAAFYTPPGGGAATACTAIYDRGRGDDRDFEVGTGSGGGIRATIARKRASIRSDEVPTIAIGGTLAIGAETLRVASRPLLDETGEIWTFDLSEVS